MNVQYNLSAKSANTTIAVSDSTGSVVYAANGETDAGKHLFTWDGKTSGGQQLPDGAYTITVTALGSDGTPVDTTTTVYGTVTSATIDPTTNQTMLNMGSVAVPLDKVVAVG
jgi:flagellar basal-body rod modification protein FlgD